MSFIIGINSNECQGIQVIHDSAHNGYISILNDTTKKTDFSIFLQNYSKNQTRIRI